MTHPNFIIIDKFFLAYGKRDFAMLKQVLAPDAKWTVRGRHPLAGIKNGFDEVIGFFDAMGAIMGTSKVKEEKLIVGANDDYVIESQHVWTNRSDGKNLDHTVCVLWRFSGHKIIEGTHFFSDPQSVDSFFNAVAQ